MPVSLQLVRVPDWARPATSFRVFLDSSSHGHTLAASQLHHRHTFPQVGR